MDGCTSRVDGRDTRGRYYCHVFMRGFLYIFQKSGFSRSCLAGKEDMLCSLVYKLYS